MRRQRSGLVGAIVTLALATGSPGPTRAAIHLSLPSGLPTHVGLGLAAGPNAQGLYGWMPASGIPWDYAYQYLSGGVNTGSGWETWNPSGQFALYYAQGAAGVAAIPVFSYYEIRQSNGSCAGCGEAQTDLSNLNNPATMSSYLQNFALLMQRLGSGTYGGITGYGGTAVVQVEPDLSGFAEQAVLNSVACYSYCSGQGNNPALLNAAVASSGYAPVSGYPNTYQGFNWALLHLRDLYAPNVKLAFHVSTWSTATDIGTSTSSTIDPVALGQEAGRFAAQSGVSGLPGGLHPYDLIFNDLADRDAGYYTNVLNNPSTWWDRLNVTFPNFHRWESYLGAIDAATALPIVVWQIPLGNQYFATENNTNGHYQDNRAEYLFSHMAELAQVGVIGLLFGAGNGGSTVNTDAMGDGITNPPSICTTSGMSSGQVCTTHTSTVADDDGGYLRMEGQQYYASGGYPLTGTTPTTAPSATATPVSTRTATASATATATPMTTATTTLTVPPVPTRTATAPSVQFTTWGTGQPTSALCLNTRYTVALAHLPPTSWLAVRGPGGALSTVRTDGAGAATTWLDIATAPTGAATVAVVPDDWSWLGSNPSPALATVPTTIASSCAWAFSTGGDLESIDSPTASVTFGTMGSGVLTVSVCGQRLATVATVSGGGSVSYPMTAAAAACHGLQGVYSLSVSNPLSGATAYAPTLYYDNEA